MQKLKADNSTNKLPPLWCCLLLDLIGALSYFIPVWGEWIDVVWAPVSAGLFYFLFAGKTGAIGSILTFAEETLPFVDIVPMFTIGYIIRKKELSR